MKVIVITHGIHQKGGDTVDMYDGPLTADGAKAIRELAGMIPKDCTKVYSGVMRRHLETVNLLGLSDLNNPVDICGKDEIMFRVMNGNETPVDQFWMWLHLQKTYGNAKSLILIVSRAQAYMIAYKLSGAKEEFGNFLNFCNTIEAAAKWAGSTIPLTESGQLHYFEI